MTKYNDSKRRNETTEQREARLAKMKEYNSSKRPSETTEQREARLAKECERELLEKEHRVRKKIITAHFQLEKELPIL